MQNNIGEARRSYEATHGRFTQSDAAEFFGVGVSTYKGWEQGRGKLNGENLCRIADKYGCSVDYLLMRTSNPAFEAVRVRGLAEDEERLVGLYRRAEEDKKPTILAVVETISGDARQLPASARRAG